jgi:hypothetical protein
LAADDDKFWRPSDPGSRSDDMLKLSSEHAVPGGIEALGSDLTVPATIFLAFPAHFGDCALAVLPLTFSKMKIYVMD